MIFMVVIYFNTWTETAPITQKKLQRGEKEAWVFMHTKWKEIKNAPFSETCSKRVG